MNILDRFKAITIGEIITVVVPMGAIVGGVWWLFEPAVAGQIEKVFDKYGVTKKTFKDVQEEISTIKTEQKRVIDQNSIILFQLQQIREDMKKANAPTDQQ